MCIRDRPHTSPSGMRLVTMLPAATIEFLPIEQLGISIEYAPTKEFSNSSIPVSYTHLDVYKRQHENRCIKNTRKNYSYCYLRPVVAILHYLHGNKQSLLFHPKILSPIKRTGNKNAACRYLVRVCFSLYLSLIHI